jgi:predicted nucleic acid-binding protein
VASLHPRFQGREPPTNPGRFTTPADYELAAVLYRTCRTRGETVRKLIDCLIAAVAVRAGCEILHADADFEVLARHTDVWTHRDSPR